MLEIQNIHKRYPLHAGYFISRKQFVLAVRGVSFSIKEEECYGLVGESGSGKTTIARMLIGLLSISDGCIQYTAHDNTAFNLINSSRKDLRKFRLLARYISQDPARSLDPRMTVEKILYSGIRYTSLWVNQKNAYQRAVRALELVELDSHMLSRYPVEFSGGQRQRIAIARALITEPEVLICDEIVSSLDMPIRKKILDLILRLKSLYHLSILFISHDLSTVSYVCDRIGVLYKGRLLEEARVKDLMQNPIHPYTQRLYRAIPKLEKNVFIQDLPPLQEVSDMPMREMAPEHFVAN